jgi:hypothetical protein
LQEGGSVSLVIDTASYNSNIGLRDQDVHEYYLDVEQYPVIRFDSANEATRSGCFRALKRFERPPIMGLPPRISPPGIQDFSSFCRLPVAVSSPLPRRCDLFLQPVVKWPMLPSPHNLRLGHRELDHDEACSAFTHVATRQLARQPRADFVGRLQHVDCSSCCCPC